MAILKDFYTKNHKSFKMSKPIKELQECFGHNINYNFCYLPFMFYQSIFHRYLTCLFRYILWPFSIYHEA